MTDHELEEALGICCGETTDMQKHMHETLRILSLRYGIGGWDESIKLLHAHIGNPYSPMGSVYLHFLDKLDLIEHGSGIAGSWLTTHGAEVLKELDKRNTHKAL